MILFRSLLYFVGSIISLILITFIGFLLVFSSYPTRQKFLSQWAIFCIWWLKVTVNIKTKVIGEENIIKSSSIIVSNHQSTWETLAFQTIFPAHTWVLKRELLWLPVFGWSLALLKPIIINRGDKLKIPYGPFKGQEGLIKSTTNSKIQLSLESLGILLTYPGVKINKTSRRVVLHSNNNLKKQKSKNLNQNIFTVVIFI